MHHLACMCQWCTSLLDLLVDNGEVVRLNNDEERKLFPVGVLCQTQRMGKQLDDVLGDDVC